jgi:hypothetical protein
VRTPLFVSHARLMRLAQLPRARSPWALDSGGFSEISRHGRWRTSAAMYVRDVNRYDREIGSLEWAAPQDWMCEPAMLARTGLTVAEHQDRTVANVVEPRALWPQHSDDTCPIMPVLQGWTVEEYLSCIARYQAAGISLVDEPLVGVGSVCRRQATDEIGAVITAVADAVPGIALHGFGVKAAGLARYGDKLASADSQSWSRGARHRNVRTPECTHAGPCTWCPRWALQWREQVREGAGLARDTARITDERAPTRQIPGQLSLPVAAAATRDLRR